MATSGWIPTTTVSAPRQAGDLGECTQGVAREGVDDVERGDVDDHSLRPVPPDLVEELRAEPEELAVVERGVEGRDEVPSVAAGSRRAAAPARVSWSTSGIVRPDDLEPEEAFGLLDAALQVADRVHLAEVDADGDQRLRDLRGQPCDDDARAHQP